MPREKRHPVQCLRVQYYHAFTPSHHDELMSRTLGKLKMKQPGMSRWPPMARKTTKPRKGEYEDQDEINPVSAARRDVCPGEAGRES